MSLEYNVNARQLASELMDMGFSLAAANRNGK